MYDQCALYMNAGIIEFVSLEQILLSKLKKVLAHFAELNQRKLQFLTFSNVILHVE